MRVPEPDPDDLILRLLAAGDIRAIDEIWSQLDAYIEQDDYLSKHRGEYAARNGATTPWSTQLDVRIIQDFYIEVGGKRNTLLPVPATPLAPTGTYFLPVDQTFPFPTDPPLPGQFDIRGLAKSYASTTSPFTAHTVPTVGGAGNDFVVDVLRTNGTVVLEDVALNLVAGCVYTLA